MPWHLLAVTFDDWGTLRRRPRSQPSFEERLARALADSGFEIEQGKFLSSYERNVESFQEENRKTLRERLIHTPVTKTLLDLGWEIVPTDPAVDQAIKHAQNARGWEWYPDALQTLDTLRSRGYRLGLISNTSIPIGAQERRLLAGLFHVVTLSYEHGYLKPHPSIFISTLQSLGARPEEAAHVGNDPLTDVKGPAAIKMQTIHVKRNGESAGADIEIKSLHEILALLP